jgi:RND family efflux transporter MFP subunit
VPVKVAVPIAREVTPYEEVRGTVKADERVELHCHVSGYLEKPLFTDGDDVTKDQLLFQIDPRPFQAAYDQALAVEAVKVANRNFRTAELARNKELLPKGAVSKSEFDQSAAALEEAVASVAASKAAIETAKLNLDYTRITSPVTGRISKSLISAGNLVVADNTLLSTVVSETPMKVEFNVDEQIYLDVQAKLRAGKIPATRKKNVPVYLKLGNETGFSHQGELDFADNSFKAGTGTILLRAEFTNPKPAVGNRLLVPEMSVTVRIPIGLATKSLLVAEQAIGADLDQKYVLIVNDKMQAEKRPVKVGILDDGLRVIEEGLTANDKVIVAGQQNASRPGITLAESVVKMESYATSQATSGESPAPQQESPPAAAPGANPPAAKDSIGKPAEPGDTPPAKKQGE